MNKTKIKDEKSYIKNKKTTKNQNKNSNIRDKKQQQIKTTTK